MFNWIRKRAEAKALQEYRLDRKREMGRARSIRHYAKHKKEILKKRAKKRDFDLQSDLYNDVDY